MTNQAESAPVDAVVIGRYQGIDYKRQRICDVLAVPLRSFAWFTYIGEQPTGDHFETLRDLKAWIDDRKHEEAVACLAR